MCVYTVCIRVEVFWSCFILHGGHRLVIGCSKPRRPGGTAPPHGELMVLLLLGTFERAANRRREASCKTSSTQTAQQQELYNITLIRMYSPFCRTINFF